MTFLPIVERELRVAARLSATYRNRVIVAGVFAFVVMLIFAFGTVANNPGRVGASMFWLLAYLLLAYCVLEGVRKTADCLSEEKREGTLGLLFLTDLKGYDIVFGKLVGTSLNSVYGFLSILPLLALPLMLGGVMPGEFWRVTLALITILFLSLSTGMWVSALSREERNAMGGTLAAMAVFCALPLVMHPMLSPLYAFHVASANNYPSAVTGYWTSIWCTLAVSCVLLVWASVALPGSWQDEKFRAPDARWWNFWRRKDFLNSATRAALRAQMLRINPAYWLAGRDESQRVPMSILMIAAGIAATSFLIEASLGADLNGLPYYLSAIWVINVAIKLRMAFQSCHCLAEARRNGALEMLLVTPLTVDQIIRGQLLALKRAFYLPVIVILSLEITGLLGGLVGATYGKGDDGTGIVVIGGLTLAYLGLVVLDIFAVIWAGMWYGLSAKKEGQAALKTILYVLVLPPCCLLLFCYGVPFVVGIPIFWISWGSSNLRSEFRRFASQRYLPTPPATSPMPILQPQKPLPPII